MVACEEIRGYSTLVRALQGGGAGGIIFVGEVYEI